MGIGIILGAFIFPRSVIVFMGVILLLNDDEWLRNKFAFMKKQIEALWKA